MSEFGFSTALPDSYTPGPKTVIIGRGKKISSHPGNVMFSNIIKTELPAYSAATSKSLKSSILSRVVDRVRRECPECAFVKQDPDSGRWYAVEDFQARITTAQAFRDSLHQNYRSSKKFKQQKRKAGLKKAESSQSLGVRTGVPVAVSRSDTDLFRLKKNNFKNLEEGQCNALWGYQEEPMFNTTNLDENIFERLYDRFSTIETADPFEPTPIPEEEQKKEEEDKTNMFGSFFETPGGMDSIFDESFSKSFDTPLKSSGSSATCDRLTPEPLPLFQPTRSSSCAMTA